MCVCACVRVELASCCYGQRGGFSCKTTSRIVAVLGGCGSLAVLEHTDLYRCQVLVSSCCSDVVRMKL